MILVLFSGALSCKLDVYSVVRQFGSKINGILYLKTKETKEEKKNGKTSFRP